MIQTLIFDFGGVLVKAPNLTWLRCFEGVLGFENDPELKTIFTNPNESQLVKEMCLGNLTEDQLLDLVAFGPCSRKNGFATKDLKSDKKRGFLKTPS